MTSKILLLPKNYSCRLCFLYTIRPGLAEGRKDLMSDPRLKALACGLRDLRTRL